MEHLLRRLPFVDHVPVRAWLGAIPDEVASSHPAICMAKISASLAVGDLDGAARSAALLDEALEATGDAAELPVLRTDARVYRALLALVTGDMAGAVRQLEAVVDGDDPIRSKPAAYAQGLLGIALHWTSGAEAALHHLRDGAMARRRLTMADGGVTAHLAAAHAELGQWNRAAEAAEEAFARPPVSGSSYPSTLAAHFAMARVDDHRGRHDEAMAEAQAGLDLARTWILPGFVAWGCVEVARLVSDPGRRRQLLAEATRLLGDGEGEGGGRVAREIAALERDLAARPMLPGHGIVEPLTRRELDVLRLFRSELSLRAIADELSITHNTAKGHAKAIYRKLGVTSRGDAVSIGSRAGLL